LEYQNPISSWKDCYHQIYGCCNSLLYNEYFWWFLKSALPAIQILVEALAALLAASLAASLNLGHFIFEGDSQVVILAPQHPNIIQD
jgi:hypothetical protein